MTPLASLQTALQWLTSRYQSVLQGTNTLALASTAQAVGKSADEALRLLDDKSRLDGELKAAGNRGDFDVRNRMVGVYNRLLDKLRTLQTAQTSVLKLVTERDRFLGGLRNEAETLDPILELMSRPELSMADMQAEMNKRVEDYNREAEASFAGVLDAQLQASRVTLQADRLVQRDLLHVLDKVRYMRFVLRPILADLQTRDRQAEAERGRWKLMGGDLDSAIAVMGSGGPGVVSWSMSPTHGISQRRHLQLVAERAATSASMTHSF